MQYIGAMRPTNYGQYCGVSRALELVGERWSLLVIRELLVGPRRFNELIHGLPGIPTNTLSSRLRELEANGVVRRVLAPRPGNAIRYELTEYGIDLAPAVMALGRWGAAGLGPRGEGAIVTADSLTTTLRGAFQPEAAAGLTVGFEVQVGDAVAHLRLSVGRPEFGPGPLPDYDPDRDLRIDARESLHELMLGESPLPQAAAAGLIGVSGAPAAMPLFSRVIALPVVAAPVASPKVS